MKILIVDDSKGSRDVLKFLISKENIGTIFEASNGIEALEVINKHNTDIMITDIKMPQMDGLELIEKARKISPEMQIIVFSAFGNFEFAKKAIRFGVTDYLLKPINTEEFQKTLSTVTEKYNAAKSKLIWRSFDELISNEPPKSETLPLALSKYNALCIIRTEDSDSITTIQDFIGKNLNESAIRHTKNIITVLSAHDLDGRSLFSDMLYNQLCSLIPCSVYCADFENESIDLYNSYRFALKENREDVFWQKPHRLCTLCKDAAEPQDVTFLFSYVRDFAHQIVQSNADCKEELSSFVEKLYKHGISSKQFKCLFFELIKQLISIASVPISYEQTVEDITSASNINEIKDAFLLIVSLINKPEYQKTQDGISTITQTALKIIHTEYMNDINRTDVSKRVFVSSPYFSHIFKKETGKSFTQYLNDYRMEKAAVLLESSTKTIHSIAKTVGFSNYPYFCSQFKKYFGQTCIQYREAHWIAKEFQTIKKEGD